MSHADQDAGGGDWRMQVREMRTLSELKSPAPAVDAVRRLPDRVLRAAAYNPDHSEAGRAAAEAELRARSIGADRWRLVVPGFIGPADLARGDRLFFGWGRAVRVWSARFAVLGALSLAGLQITRALSLSDRALVEQALVAHGAGVLALVVVWALAVAFRRHPARIVVLVPPQRALTRAPLARFLRRELRPFGHVLLHAPVGPIRSAAGYRGAALLMRNKIAMNIRAARPSGVALRIGGVGGWAPITRALGEDSADAVIVDLSQDADAALATLNADPRRCVFVALWGQLDAAEAALAQRGIAAPVHHYAPDGEIQRRAAFRAAMLAAMRATHNVSA